MDAPTPPAADPSEGTGRRRRAWLIGGGVAAVLVVVAIAVGVFGVHTLFIDEEVSEAGPEFDSGAVVATSSPDAPSSTASPTDESAEPDDPAPTTTTISTPIVRTVASGSFEAVDHPGSGSVTLLSDGSQTFVRFEDDFSTDNGPDLFAVAYADGQRIELGVLKGNRGAQNYELPASVDPEAVETVAVWCKRFDSTFTEAPLARP